MINFIKHYLGWMALQSDDERLSPHHVSLYLALFHYWNSSRFRNPITICREDMMQLSKIGSASTYVRCLKELSTWRYIRYHPSYNAHCGSKIYMRRFDKDADDGKKDTDTDQHDTDTCTDSDQNDTGTCTDADQKDTGTGITSVQAKEPYTINILNNTNPKNKLKAYESANKNSDLYNDGTPAKTEASGHSKNTVYDGGGAAAIPESIEAAKAFFAQARSTPLEAERFYYYFESNGWRVGGRAAMKNWQAAAHNWILNSKKFNHERNRPTPGRLGTTTNKNFAEPL